MTDARLVSQETLSSVAAEVAAEAPERNIVESIATREPVLAAYIAERMLMVSGKLALCGAPPEIVQGCYEEVAKLIATSVRVVWRASDDLWSGIDMADIGRRPSRARRRGPTRGAAASARAARGEI